MNEPVRTDSAPPPVGAYPHARRVGSLLFCSGVGPRRPGQNTVPGVRLDEAGRLVDYDFAAQCRACFENVRAVVQAGGARFEDIVDVQVYLTDLERDFATFNALWREFFAGPGKPNPCRTTIQVSALPQGGDAPIAVELKVVAVLPEGDAAAG
ncbi:MAG: reactive intermediate/imine deaminase [Phycisphaerales bacterium]|nr:MAG: reactive intermediate/imine deaminase [Phycisphaerales bacterium]